jgi:hypothetical protein
VDLVSSIFLLLNELHPLRTTTCNLYWNGSLVTSSANCPGYGTPIQYVQVTASASVPALFSWPGSSPLSSCMKMQPTGCDGRRDESCTHPCFFAGLARIERCGLIETAPVLPIFVLLMLGLFTFSIVLFGFCNATYAARVGARFDGLNSSNRVPT